MEDILQLLNIALHHALVIDAKSDRVCEDMEHCLAALKDAISIVERKIGSRQPRMRFL